MVWRQAIIWTNAGILLIQTLGQKLWNLKRNSYIFIQETFLKMSSKWWQFCLGLSLLISVIQIWQYTVHYVLHICFKSNRMSQKWSSTQKAFDLENYFAMHYGSIIMGAMASQITSLTIVYPSVYSGAVQRKHQTPRHWPLWGEFTGDRWIPRTKGQ